MHWSAACLPSLGVILFSFSVVKKQLWGQQEGAHKRMPNAKLEMVIDVNLEWSSEIV
jgi:hypothetical protein